MFYLNRVGKYLSVLLCCRPSIEDIEYFTKNESTEATPIIQLEECKWYSHIMLTVPFTLSETLNNQYEKNIDIVSHSTDIALDYYTY